jgi:putative metallohydrolase (TIGR04338 family)
LEWYQKTITLKSAVSIVIHRSKKFGSRKGTMSSRRDNQRERVYRGERQSGLQTPVSKLDPMTIRQCQKFIDKVLSRKSVAKVYGKRRITVERGRGGGRAFFENGDRIVSLGVWARQPIVLLHEIAHHLAPNNVQHGPEFVEAMLKITRQVLGKEAEEKLLAGYALHGVRTCGKNGKPRKVRCPQSKKAWLEEQKGLKQLAKS